MPDALHLSPAGYRIWADAVAEALRPVLSAPAPVAPNAAPAASR
jgi:lysophospholipase L1-like esterase